MISYEMALDPDNKVLVDLATKCGVIGGNRSDITVNYKITVGSDVIPPALLLRSFPAWHESVLYPYITSDREHLYLRLSRVGFRPCR